MRRIVQVIAVLASCLAAGTVSAAADDHSYDSIRDVVSVLHLDLSKMQE